MTVAFSARREAAMAASKARPRSTDDYFSPAALAADLVPHAKGKLDSFSGHKCVGRSVHKLVIRNI